MAKRLAVAGLGSRATEQAAAWLSKDRVRVLGFHGIPDVERFTGQMEHLTKHYVPIDGSSFIRALRRAEPLPPRAVWITFDDGLPEVIDQGMPVLERLNIPATLFVCPGVVGTAQPFWWDIVETALDLHVRPGGLLPRVPDQALLSVLKTVPDRERRTAVNMLQRSIARHTGSEMARRQVTEEQLTRWYGSGFELGNHTWDHPCLDQCSVEEQRIQIERAHHWLAQRFPTATRMFAYPNGNRTSASEHALVRHDYNLALLFDHRLTKPDGPPLRISRLRVSADADLQRFRAIVSGAHSSVFNIGAQVRQRPLVRRGAIG